MCSLLTFYEIAAMRGDGLHPLLRDLFEQRAAIEQAGGVVDLSAARPGEPVQAGPNPAPTAAAFRPGNVIGFEAARRVEAVDARKSSTS